MAEYYLISQLPSLDGIGENMPLPITEEAFLKLCESTLSKKVWQQLKMLSLVPPRVGEKSPSALINAWNEGERNLRLALGVARAEKMKKEFNVGNEIFSSEVLGAAATAVDSKTPWEAESFLNTYRLNFLDSLRPMDNFSSEFLFYYCLKLKLLSRIRQFSTELGKSAYKNIYNSILNGDRLEAIQ